MINKVILLGNLGGDPQVKFSQNGTMVAIMKLATTEYVKKNGNLSPITEWHTVYAYGKLAEFCSELRKGDKIFVEGKLRKVSFESDNKIFRISNIIAKSVKLVSRRISSNSITIPVNEEVVDPLNPNESSSLLNGNLSPKDEFATDTVEIFSEEDTLLSDDSDLF